jgi:outer membrane protein
MKRKRARSLGFGLLLLLAASGPVLAQSDLKVGFVNLNQIIQNHPRTMELNETLRNEFAPRETELRSMQTELREKAERYERDESVMSESDRTVLLREIQQGQRDLERLAAVLEEDLQIRQNELLQQLQREVVRQVQTYLAEEEYDLVLADAIYVSEDANITEQVFEAITAGADADD